ncbi:MAG: hypothetical protein R3E21_00490 [Caenibius sp.]
MDKKRPGRKAGRAMKVWERMPERQVLFAPHKDISQLQKHEPPLRFLQQTSPMRWNMQFIFSIAFREKIESAETL